MLLATVGAESISKMIYMTQQVYYPNSWDHALLTFPYLTFAFKVRTIICMWQTQKLSLQLLDHDLEYIRRGLCFW